MQQVRTRFAPSPTGYMHIGNLRTALYAYLFAKSADGRFILRIEDTDRARFVADATDIIKDTLRIANLIWDEGPDVGGEYGPYIQSERGEIYRRYDAELIDKGGAYYCFCSADDKHDGKSCACRELSAEDAKRRIENGEPYAIRQKMPETGETTYFDELHGNITIANSELEDQILLKSDGMPTYNFANVIDDHLMKVTHIIRGEEFITSTPKHVLLYETYGWDKPAFIHLAPVMGKNDDGSISKLSKRHGATSFADLTAMGYLPDAIINYVALLGWSPKNSNEEIFSLKELIERFSLDGLSKSPAVFDYDKLGWLNGEYLKRMPADAFADAARPFAKDLPDNVTANWTKLAELLQTRITHLGEIPQATAFLKEMPPFDANLYENKRNKMTAQKAKEILPPIADILEKIDEAHWDNDTLYDTISAYIADTGLKKGSALWPIRISIAGQAATPGGATELLTILGKKESLDRMKKSLANLSAL